MPERKIRKNGPEGRGKTTSRPEKLVTTQNTQHNIKREGLGPNADRNQQR